MILGTGVGRRKVKLVELGAPIKLVLSIKICLFLAYGHNIFCWSVPLHNKWPLLFLLPLSTPCLLRTYHLRQWSIPRSNRYEASITFLIYKH